MSDSTTSSPDKPLKTDFIAELLRQLPTVPKLDRSLFDIAGFPRWENVNSNCLAFYLDEKEEHGFGRLFLDSLVKLAEEQTQSAFNTEGTYHVVREQGTDTQKRIDLFLHTPDEGFAPEDGWTILIENKIGAWLYNDLGKYADRIHTKRSLRIVLSPFSMKTAHEKKKLKDNDFIHIKHSDWMAEIQQRRPLYDTKGDARQQYILNEFLLSVQHISQSPMIEARNEEIRFQFGQNAENVKALFEASEALDKHIMASCITAMEQLGYDPASRIPTKGKWFHRNDSAHPAEGKSLRLYVRLDDLRFADILTCYYELYGTAVQYGSAVRSTLMNQLKEVAQGPDPVVSWGKKDKAGSYFQLFYLQLHLDDGEGTLAQRIQSQIETHFIGRDYRDAAINALEKAKQPSTGTNV